ncbi:MAG: TonB family protein [Deferribacterota bacterium]|nr:TonB family protein [Deferribacterota bacterium]
MDRKLFIFIIISLIIHLLILSSITLEQKKGIKKNRPIIVELPKNLKESNKPPETPDLLTDRDINLKKKTEDKKEKKETNIKVSEKEDKRKLKTNIKEKKVEDKQEKVSKTKQKKEKRELLTRKKSKEKIVKTEEKQQEKQISKKEDKTQDVEIPKVTEDKETNKNKLANKEEDLLSKILNPKDVINKIAEEEQNSQKEGEDSVNIQAMKFKYYSYFYKFSRLLHQVWEYPRQSILNGEEGVVRIKFSILDNGKITNIRVIQSSGYPDLDQAAVRALKTMKGIPLPDSYNLNILHVDGHFAYKIHRFYIY